MGTVTPGRATALQIFLNVSALKMPDWNEWLLAILKLTQM